MFKLQIERQRSGFTVKGKTKLLIALRYYAEGGSLKAIGDMFGVSKSSVSVIIWEVSFLIGIKLKDRFLQMPRSREEILDVKATYFKVENFPLCLTCIDGTHIRVQSFGGENAEEYRNRKTYFSINCQAAVSANVIFSKIYYESIFKINLRIRIPIYSFLQNYGFQLKFFDVVTRWPGSAHDSTIFSNSTLFERFQRGDFGYDSAILADKAYGPEKFICKPIYHDHELLTEAEKKYQYSQIKTRNTVERSFGVLKKRFACLQFGMHFRELAKVQDIILACCILHNMCIDQNEHETNNDNDIQMQATIGARYLQEYAANQRLRIQNFLINYHFTQ